jgi:hypothetical protein
MRIIILSLFLIGCGKPKILSIEPKMQYLINNFEQKSKILGKPIKIDNLILEFKDTYNNESILGQCGIKNNTPKITIKKSYFEASNKALKEIIVFHELGHCLLNRDHLSGYDYGNHRLYSIMNAYEFNDEMYKLNYDYYLKELFGVINYTEIPTRTDFIFED